MADDRKAGETAGRHRPTDRGPGDFGSRLREARERKGVSLREIANATKISIRALEALERNDISHLPGGIFSRSFVRAYAAEAGLDPDETVDDFVRQFPHDSVIAGHAASVHVDEDDDESNRRTARVILRLVGISIPAAAVVLYFGLANRRGSSADAETVSRPVARTEVADTTLAPAPLDRLGLQVSAKTACTLTTAVDGQPSVETRLDAGGRQSFDAQTELMLTVSDPAAVDVTVNGRAIRSLGPAGVSTTIRLTPSNYQEFLARQ